MKRFIFYGYSDDNLQIGGDVRRSKPCSNGVGSVVLRSSEGAMRVTAVYAPNDKAATWCIGISPVDEYVAIPDWKTTYSLHDSGYSAELSIECPDDTVLEEKV